MSDVVSFFATPSRKSNFATITVIVKDGPKKHVIKSPMLADAEKHVQKMSETYEVLEKSDCFKKIQLVPLAQRDKSMVFPFIEGSQADSVLMDLVIKQDKRGMSAIVNRVAELIESLPSKKVIPANNPSFVKVFGNYYDKKTDCTSLGLIDLNFDNFIIDGSGIWHLYDYEWFFDFPVPKDYLLRRFMFWFATANFRDDVTIHKFLGSDFLELVENVYVPDFFAKSFKSFFSNAEKFIKSETHFQNTLNQMPIESPMWYLTAKKINKNDASRILEQSAETAYRRLEEAYLANRDLLDKHRQ